MIKNTSSPVTGSIPAAMPVISSVPPLALHELFHSDLCPNDQNIPAPNQPLTTHQTNIQLKKKFHYTKPIPQTPAMTSATNSNYFTTPLDPTKRKMTQPLVPAPKRKSHCTDFVPKTNVPRNAHTLSLNTCTKEIELAVANIPE